MKKLIDYIKVKDRDNNLTSADKKAEPKSKKSKSSLSNEDASNKPNDLFWDEYSDIGYC